LKREAVVGLLIVAAFLLACSSEASSASLPAEQPPRGSNYTMSRVLTVAENFYPDCKVNINNPSNDP
jgi:hypothetical protein